MKNPVAAAVLSFVGLIAVFAFLDLAFAHFDTAAFVKEFTKPLHLAFAGGLGLINAVVAFFQTRKKAAA